MLLRASLALRNLKNVHGSVTYLEISFSVTNMLIGSSSMSTIVNIKAKKLILKYINHDSKLARIIKINKFETKINAKLRQVGVYKVLNFSLPVNKSKNKIKSDNKLYSGYLKVAGLFFSKKKCPIQAKPYPTNGIANNKL
jgi:hypothetical protein